MNSYKFGLIFLLAIFLVGCAPSRAARMYYWGDYSRTLYGSKKNPSDEAILKHKQVLENIVEESNKNNLRIPPGVYAELGYIYFRQNNNQLAIQYFRQEKAIYPEAALFMDRLENAANLKDKPKAPAENTAQKPQDILEKAVK